MECRILSVLSPVMLAEKTTDVKIVSEILSDSYLSDRFREVPSTGHFCILSPGCQNDQLIDRLNMGRLSK
jgi:hypothetical protein